MEEEIFEQPCSPRAPRKQSNDIILALADESVGIRRPLDLSVLS